MRSFATALAILLLIASPSVADDLTRAAQIRLQELGFFDFSIDGQWGPRTAAAVQRYQLAENLEVTGTLNRQTLDHLGIRTRPQSAPTATTTPVPTYKAIADLFVGGPYLKAPTEMQLRVIKDAQKNLHTLGFYNGPTDGYPNAALTAALRAYQESSRFKRTGRLDKTTLQGLNLLTLPY